MADPTSTPPGAPSPGPRRIRSVPDPVKGRSLISETAVGHAGDANWRRGVTVLWMIFGLLALAEGCTVLFGALAGDSLHNPPYAALRLVPLCLVFLSLWFGWGWLRWLFAIGAFLFGTWEIIDFFRASDAAFQASGGAKQTSQILYNAPLIIGAVMYLVMAGYLLFSGDVSGFIKHRREEGRAWIILPVTALLVGYVVLVFALPNLCAAWVASERKQAASFGQESLRAMSQQWDLATFESICDESFLKAASPDVRQSVVRGLKPFGPALEFGEEHSTADSGFDSSTDRFFLHGTYDAKIKFTHGQAKMSLTLNHPLTGGWRLANIQMSDIEMEKPPAPAATPAPAGVPTPTAPTPAPATTP